MREIGQLARARGVVRSEIGDLRTGLNQLNVNMQSLVNDVRHGVNGMSDATSEIAATLRAGADR